MQADSFHHVVANDELDRAVEELENIVRSQLTATGTMSDS
jgi:guanylate kinase